MLQCIVTIYARRYQFVREVIPNASVFNLGDAAVPANVARHGGARLQPAAGQCQLCAELVGRTVLHSHALHRGSGQSSARTYFMVSVFVNEVQLYSRTVLFFGGFRMT